MYMFVYDVARWNMHGRDSICELLSSSTLALCFYVTSKKNVRNTCQEMRIRLSTPPPLPY
jgi:hypothetical protein